MRSEAVNAENAPETTIGGVLRMRSAPTGSMLRLIPIPRSKKHRQSTRHTLSQRIRPGMKARDDRSRHRARSRRRPSTLNHQRSAPHSPATPSLRYSIPVSAPLQRSITPPPHRRSQSNRRDANNAEQRANRKPPSILYPPSSPAAPLQLHSVAFTPYSPQNLSLAPSPNPRAPPLHHAANPPTPNPALHHSTTPIPRPKHTYNTNPCFTRGTRCYTRAPINPFIHQSTNPFLPQVGLRGVGQTCLPASRRSTTPRAWRAGTRVRSVSNPCILRHNLPAAASSRNRSPPPDPPHRSAVRPCAPPKSMVLLYLYGNTNNNSHIQTPSDNTQGAGQGLSRQARNAPYLDSRA